ncbi:MAG: cation:proton antiporter, partial [Acidobacteriota bacterium]
MEANSPFVSLLLITLLALVVPFLANRIKIVKIPIVVGEILAGIVIGRSGFNLVEATPTLNFLSEFGFAMLMFLSGLEVNFEMLRSSGETGEKTSVLQRPTTLAILYFLITVALAMIVAFALDNLKLTSNPILLGLILSTTSLGIVVPMLKERQLTETAYGQSILVAALI